MFTVFYTVDCLSRGGLLSRDYFTFFCGVRETDHSTVHSAPEREASVRAIFLKQDDHVREYEQNGVTIPNSEKAHSFFFTLVLRAVSAKCFFS